MLRTPKDLENQNIFKTLFNMHWLKVDVNYNNIIDVRQKTWKLKDMWTTLISTETYKRLNYRAKRKYCKQRFYEWLAEQTKVTDCKQTGKKVTGYIVSKP